MSERCRDSAVSVKKKALQCVGELLTVGFERQRQQQEREREKEKTLLHISTSDLQAKPTCSVVQKAWLQGVVPTVMDSESSVQDKALEALDQVLLSQVKPYSPSRYLDTSQRLTWDLLGLLCDECQNLRLDILENKIKCMKQILHEEPNMNIFVFMCVSLR